MVGAVAGDEDRTEDVRVHPGDGVEGGEGGASGGEPAPARRGRRLRDGRYVLERTLGRGGMAAVWLARDRRLDRPVAIKVLSDTLAGDGTYLARFEREARVAAGLAHPNLIRVYDYGVERGRPFLVMEYVSGGDLADRIAADEAPDADRLARELLEALRHIHAAGVLHRDVKTRNVLIDAEGRARLTDFGIAQPADATSLTQTGTVLGTARYIAPEVLGGEPPSERSDLYSLGVVLAEVAAAGHARPELSRLIGALRAEDQRHRPASAAAALRGFARPGRAGGRVAATAPQAPARHRPASPPPAVPPEPAAAGSPRPSSGPRRALAGAAIAAAILAVVAVVALTGGGGDPGPSGELAPGGRSQAETGSEGSGGGAERDRPAEAETGSPDEEESSSSEPAADGSALNDRGFALINSGRPGEAIPVLRRAVDALAGSEDIAYAYALFNLGSALRLAGRPQEAIPILRARLEIPNQKGVVRRELRAALADAGLDDERPGRGRGRGRGGDDDDD